MTDRMREVNRSGRIGARVLSVFALFFVTAAIALAQGEPTQPAPAKPSADAPANAGDTQQNPTGGPIRIQSNLVTAPVSVIDKATGEFVYNLDQKDFQDRKSVV